MVANLASVRTRTEKLYQYKRRGYSAVWALEFDILYLDDY